MSSIPFSSVWKLNRLQLLPEPHLTSPSLHRAVSFFSASTSTGLSIPYPLITLHAISRVPLRPFTAPSADSNGSAESGGGPCIYCQIDETEGAEDDGEGTTREVIIVPTNPASRAFSLILPKFLADALRSRQDLRNPLDLRRPPPSHALRRWWVRRVWP